MTSHNFKVKAQFTIICEIYDAYFIELPTFSLGILIFSFTTFSSKDYASLFAMLIGYNRSVFQNSAIY